MSPTSYASSFSKSFSHSYSSILFVQARFRAQRAAAEENSHFVGYFLA